MPSAGWRPWPDTPGWLVAVAGDLGLTDLLERLDARLTDLPGLAGVAEGWARAGDPGRSVAAADRLAALGQASEDEEDTVGRAAAAVELLGHPMLITVRRALTAEMVARLVASGLRGFGVEDENTAVRTGGADDALARAIAACGAVVGLDALARIEALVDDDTNYRYCDLARAYAALGDGESTLRCLQRMKLTYLAARRRRCVGGPGAGRGRPATWRAGSRTWRWRPARRRPSWPP